MGLFNPPDVNGPLGLVAVAIWLLAMAIFFRAILSWVIRDPYNPIMQALDLVTEPILQPLRQVLPRIGMIDISPMVALIVLVIIAQTLSSFEG